MGVPQTGPSELEAAQRAKQTTVLGNGRVGTTVAKPAFGKQTQVCCSKFSRILGLLFHVYKTFCMCKCAFVFACISLLVHFIGTCKCVCTYIN